MLQPIAAELMVSREVQLPAPGMATNERDPGSESSKSIYHPGRRAGMEVKDQQRQGGGVCRDHRVHLGFGSRQGQWEDQIPAL